MSKGPQTKRKVKKKAIEMQVKKKGMKGKQIPFGVSFTVSLGLGKHSAHSPWIERVNESKRERVRQTKSISVELE